MKTKSKSLFDRFKKIDTVDSSEEKAVPLSNSKRGTEVFFGLWMDKAMHRRLKFLALEQETNVKVIVCEAIRKHIAEIERGDG